MLKHITCFWKGDWKLSLFPWLILALLLIYFFHVILLSQPVGFYFSEGILQGNQSSRWSLEKWRGDMLVLERIFFFFPLRKEVCLEWILETSAV